MTVLTIATVGDPALRRARADDVGPDELASAGIQRLIDHRIRP
jgi:hypothetical protein